MIVIVIIGFILAFVMAIVLTSLYCGPQVPKIVEMIFFSVLICCGLLLIGFTIYAKVYEVSVKGHAVFATATVTSIDTSYIEIKQGLYDQGERSYYNTVTYMYEAGGKFYTCTTPERDQFFSLLGGYKVGGTVEVYYLPDHPEEAYVLKNMNIGMIQNLLVGFAMVIFLSKRIIKLKKELSTLPKQRFTHRIRSGHLPQRKTSKKNRGGKR